MQGELKVRIRHILVDWVKCSKDLFGYFGLNVAKELKPCKRNFITLSYRKNSVCIKEAIGENGIGEDTARKNNN